MPQEPHPQQPAETRADFQLWLNRYASPDGYSRWKLALRGKQKNAPFLAFAAIAGDEDLLGRLPVVDATALVRDALVYARESMSARVTSQGTAIAMETVAIRSETWRRYVERQRQGADLSLPPPTGDAAVDDSPAVSLDDQALAAFPQVVRSTAPHLIETVLRLGIAGLLQVPPPMDMVYALGAARVASRSHRGASLGGKPISKADCLRAVAAVQGWSLAKGANPFVAAGHGGAAGSLAERVTSLLMDASGCLGLAAELPGGAGAPGFDMWETAEESLAYAFVALQASRLRHMGYDTAVHLAAAAGRMAERVIADPERALAALPSGWKPVKPATVVSMARAVTRGPFAPRRSALTRACEAEVIAPVLAVPIPIVAEEEPVSLLSRIYQPARRGMERLLR